MGPFRRTDPGTVRPAGSGRCIPWSRVFDGGRLLESVGGAKRSRGISNFDGWSKREEVWQVPSNSKAARFIAAVFKKYEWQEGAQTDDFDDGEEFIAFFDDLFLFPATEPKGPQEPPPQRADFFGPEPSRGTLTLQRHGKDVVAAPKLEVRLTGEGSQG